jgi:DNA polymerase
VFIGNEPQDVESLLNLAVMKIAEETGIWESKLSITKVEKAEGEYRCEISDLLAHHLGDFLEQPPRTPLKTSNKAQSEEWQKLRQDIKQCQRCHLYKSGVQPVPGEGPDDSAICFVGEAPSDAAQASGRPFTGPAGDVLNEWLTELGLKREGIYLTNVLKCSLKGWSEQGEACKPFLDRELALLKPKLVVALGIRAVQSFFPGEFWGAPRYVARLERAHGRVRIVGDTAYFAMYHPINIARGISWAANAPIDRDLSRLNCLLDMLFGVDTR